MAKKIKSKLPQTHGTAEGGSGDDTDRPKKPQLGAGWHDATPRTADGWFQAAEGAWLLGRLVGRYTMAPQMDPDGRVKRRAYYQIEVAQADATAGVKDAPSIEVERGHLINLDERKGVTELRKYTDSDGLFDVYIEIGAKKKLSGGRTFWPTAVRVKTLRAPTRPLVEPEPEPDLEAPNYDNFDDSDIPF